MRAIALILVLLMSACAPRADFGTETRAAWCAAIGETLPTYSSKDTEQTKIEGDKHLTTLSALCPELFD